MLVVAARGQAPRTHAHGEKRGVVDACRVENIDNFGVFHPDLRKLNQLIISQKREKINLEQKKSVKMKIFFEIIKKSVAKREKYDILYM